MSKSLDFIINMIKTGRCNNLKIDEFKDVFDYKFSDAVGLFNDNIKELYKNNNMMLTIDGDYRGQKGRKTIVINYNPNTDYDYFTTEGCMCDGTLLFMNNLMVSIMCNLFQGQTCFKKSIPIDYEDNFWNYDVVYTVGDFICNSFIDKNIAPKEKPWMCDKFTVMLPIKCEFIKRIKE